ncbi:TRAP transporter substrate-binding protein DctP [bacterium]|nr:TRAP transporter substrate-binding protein DctP [bacterium]
MRKSILMLITMAFILVFFGITGNAEEKIVLKLADSLPPTHFLSVNAGQFWMNKVKEYTGGKVEFQHYPAQQLGKAKDLLTLTQTGVTDIGYVCPAYASDKLPLSSVGELPGMFDSSCQGSAAIWKLAKSGILDQEEFAKNGLKVLFAFSLVPYRVFTTERAKIDSLNSLRGMKIRAAGQSIPAALESLGVVPIRMSAPEVRESISRGTIDGSIAPFSSIKPYGMTELVKYATSGVDFGSFIATYSISINKWNSLPSDIQQAMVTAGDETVINFCRFMDKSESKARAALVKGGLIVYELTSEEKKSVAKSFAPLREQWVSTMNSRGLPASKVMADYLKAVQQ